MSQGGRNIGRHRNCLGKQHVPDGPRPFPGGGVCQSVSCLCRCYIQPRRGRTCPPLFVADEEDLLSKMSQQQSGEDHEGGNMRFIVGCMRSTPMTPSGCWGIFGLLAAFLPPPRLPYTVRYTIDTTMVYGFNNRRSNGLLLSRRGGKSANR